MLDDLVCHSRLQNSSTAKALVQIKRTLKPRKSFAAFKDAIEAAWRDFGNRTLFQRGTDSLCVVYDGHGDSVMRGAETLVARARKSLSCAELVIKVAAEKFSAPSIRAASAEICAIVANASGRAVDADELHAFLCHLQFVSIHLSTVESVEHTGRLALIRLALGSDAALTPQAVWAELVAACLDFNANAASVTLNNLSPPLSFALIAAFAVGRGQARVDSPRAALLRHSCAVLSTASVALPGGLAIARDDLVERILGDLESSKAVLVAGEAGSGKSAVAKLALARLDDGCRTLAFKSEDFEHASLEAALSAIGVAGGADGLTAQLSLEPVVTLLIDGAEKLIEFTRREAFAQLIALVGDQPRWRLLITARSQSIEVLCTAFLPALPTKLVRVPELTDAELDAVVQETPALFALPQWPELHSVLRNPFYLQLALWRLQSPVAVESLRGRSTSDLKHFLWQYAVERPDKNRSGMPERRQQAFTATCVHRAQRLTQYVDSPADAEAVGALVNDGILRRDEYGRVAPSHDVFDDWALRRHVGKAVIDCERDWPRLFSVLGTHPGIRRAYRAWLTDALADQDANALAVAEAGLVESTIAQFWRDDTCIGLLRSAAAEPFLSARTALLFGTEQALVRRLVHLTRVACKGPNEEVLSAASGGAATVRRRLEALLTSPTTNAWKTLINLLASQSPNPGLGTDTHWVVDFLEDWAMGLNVWAETPPEAIPAVRVALHVFEGIEAKSPYVDETVEQALELVLKLVGGDPAAVGAALRQLMSADDEPDDGRRTRDVERILRFATKTFTCIPLCVHLPELAIEAFNASRRVPIDYVQESWGHAELEESFGFWAHREHAYFPASAYQGVFWPLLQAHPAKAVDFIVQLANDSAARFTASTFGAECWSIPWPIGDAGAALVCSERLWGLYRGVTVGPSDLESALMALERWLLRMAAPNGMSPDTVRQILRRVLRRSTSVLTVAVVASVFNAHPDLVDAETVGLFSARDLYRLDLERTIPERGHSVDMRKLIGDPNSSHAPHYDERVESQGLEHRSRHLEYTALVLQWGTLRAAMLGLLDAFIAGLPVTTAQSDSDKAWRLAIRRMDSRGLRFGTPTPEGIPLEVAQPLEPDLEQFVGRHQEGSSQFFRLSRLQMWAKSHFENNRDQGGSYADFREAVTDLEALIAGDQSELPMGRSRVEGAVGATLLYRYRDALTPEEESWAIAQIVKAVSAPVDPEDIGAVVARFSVDGSRASAYALGAVIDHVEHRLAVRHALATALTHASVEVREYAARGVREVLFARNPRLGEICVAGLVELSKSKSAAFEGPYDAIRGTRSAAMHATRAAIASWLEVGQGVPLQMEALPRDAEDLVMALFAVPFELASTWFEDLLHAVVRAMADFEAAPRRDRRSRGERSRKRQPPFEAIRAVARRFALHLHAQGVSEQGRSATLIRDLSEVAPKFMSNVLDELLSCQDRDARSEHFWQTWRIAAPVCFGQASLAHSGAGRYSSDYDPLLRTLLFAGTQWKDEARDFSALASEDGFLQEAFERVGTSPLGFQCLVRLLQGIGRTRYLPQALLRVSDAVTRASPALDLLAGSTEVFYVGAVLRTCVLEHNTTIRSDVALRAAALGLLDHLVDAGSSVAFQLREYFVTAPVA